MTRATDPGWLSRVLTTAHRVCVGAYPPAFRARFGDDLDRTFAARLVACRGPLVRLVFGVWGCADAVLSGWRERRFHQPVDRSPRGSLDALAADLRRAAKRLWRSPRFTAITLVTLTLGLGANAAIFNVVHAVLLRPLPYGHPDRLVIVWSDNRRQHEPQNGLSPANLEAFQRANTTLSGLEPMYSFLVPVQLGEPGRVEYAQAAMVSSALFGVLDRQAALGRTLQPGDLDSAAVLSHTYWQQRFGGDRDIVGRTIHTPNSPDPFRVVGVMPADFLFPYRSMLGPSGFSRATQPDLWLPIPSTDTRMRDASGQPSRTVHYLAGIGRLVPGATLVQAQADLAAIADERVRTFPDTNTDWGVTVRGLHDQTVSGMRPALIALWAGAGLLLIVACVNVASLVLARAAGEERDLAVCAALGASRGRLVQQAMLESVLLAGTAGAFGLVLMMASQRLLLRWAPAGLVRLDGLGANATVTIVVLATALLAAVLIGVLPAWLTGRTQPSGALRESRRTTTSAHGLRLRSTLVVAEIAIATTLALGAVLLLRSFVAVLHVDPGFDPEQVLSLQLNLPQRLADAPARLAFYDDLESRLSAVPGIIRIGGTTRLPLGSTSVSTVLAVEGRSATPRDLVEVELRRAVFDYFETMRMPVRRGRTFTRNDGPTAPTVVVINDALAARVFPGEDAIGRRVSLGGLPTGPWATVIGVVGNVRHGSLEERPKPELYITYRQGPPASPFLVLRSTADPSAVVGSVRNVLRELGVDAPYNISPLATVRSDSMADRRFVLLLIGLFGALALSLAASGVYGVVSLTVAEREREFAVRLALGARHLGVVGAVLRQALTLAAAGVAIGLALDLGAARWLVLLLFGVPVWDPISLFAVIAVLLAIAGLAAVVPAQRIARVDPAAVLR